MNAIAATEPLQATAATQPREATLYRMVMDGHVCPYGLKAKSLLERQGYAVDDHWLKTRDEVDAFKSAHNVKTTPQTFIGGQRVGGFDDLSRFFGKAVADPSATSYTPVMALFSLTALMALAAAWPLSEHRLPCKRQNGSLRSAWRHWPCSSFRTLKAFRLCS
jgi:glutaredoxin